MAKTQNKTTQTKQSVTEFLSSVADEGKRKDSQQLAKIMKEVTGFTAKMWGANIVGFGSYHYKYATGREGDAPLVAFSPRSNALSIYLAQEFTDKEKLLKQFGKHTAGAGCIYVKKITDIDVEVLRTMITNSVEHLQEMYPEK